ncbi:MAG: hypothetical protein ACXVIG_02705 [Halobacteriota archaeon]
MTSAAMTFLTWHKEDTHNGRRGEKMCVKQSDKHEGEATRRYQPGSERA